MPDTTKTSGHQREKTLENVMRRYEAQSVLFAPRPSRLALSRLELATTGKRRLQVNVWRNHAFEPLISLEAPYFHYMGCQVNFHLGAYDDTLMFAGRQEADAELLWLDSRRFPLHAGFADWLRWLDGRLRTLRVGNTAPIVLATWTEGREAVQALQALADNLPAVYFADLGAICAEAGVPLLDPRSAKLAGTFLSNAAQLMIAREMACHWLPALLLPPVKAVVLDLDHTLHSGVLAEDGVHGVQLTQGHIGFQRYVKSLRQRGIFIALVSRNEPPDVDALFSERHDYPLRREDFSVVEVSWGDKAAALKRIAKVLCIGLDAVLFVDDNAGELASIATQLPQVHTAFAHSDASLTRQVVHFYPGLWRWKVEIEDTWRIQDLRANLQRQALATDVIDPAEYFRSLHVTMTCRHNPQEQLSRLADLCKKTNQFNLALRRFNHAELAERLSRSDACVASVELTDRLSDSGVIALIVAERQGERLVVEELCVSCRAMGRQLESTIILTALRDMPIFAGCREVVFTVRQGPRNQPALDWLSQLLGYGEIPLLASYSMPSRYLLDFVAAEGVTVIKG